MCYKLMIFFLLLFYAWTDIKEKQIFWPPAVFVSGVALILHLLEADLPAAELLPAAVFGAGLLALAWGTGQKIGYGDGITVLACGLSLGFFDAFYMVQLALVLAAVWSVILLLGRRTDRHGVIPFVPFLFLSYCCFLVF